MTADCVADKAAAPALKDMKPYRGQALNAPESSTTTSNCASGWAANWPASISTARRLAMAMCRGLVQSHFNVNVPQPVQRAAPVADTAGRPAVAPGRQPGWAHACPAGRSSNCPAPPQALGNSEVLLTGLGNTGQDEPVAGCYRLRRIATRPNLRLVIAAAPNKTANRPADADGLAVGIGAAGRPAAA